MKNRIVKSITAFCAFIGAFLVYHIIGSNFFPVDENNVLQAPNWYPLLGMLIAGVVAYFAVKQRGRTRFDNKEVDKCLAEADKILGGRLQKSENELSALYNEAIDLIFRHRQASASLLERYLKISFRNACDILDYLESCGIVGSFFGSAPRKILAPNAEKAKIMARNPMIQSSKIDCNLIMQNEMNWRKKQLGLSSIEYELKKVDGMEGHEFEHWCAELLRKNGFTNVEVTKASRDQGVDVLAVKDGIRYAFQCKCYSSDLGNKPVQEVHAGKAMYRCQVGVVITNRHFTAGAKELAEATGVLLWDRDRIISLLEGLSPDTLPISAQN